MTESIDLKAFCSQHGCQLRDPPPRSGTLINLPPPKLPSKRRSGSRRVGGEKVWVVVRKKRV
jgi:hypothetical protein